MTSTTSISNSLRVKKREVEEDFFAIFSKAINEKEKSDLEEENGQYLGQEIADYQRRFEMRKGEESYFLELEEIYNEDAIRNKYRKARGGRFVKRIKFLKE